MWKLISESKSTTVSIDGIMHTAVGLEQHYYINELGEVKYENTLGESKILSVGDGLWVNKDGDILDTNTVNEIKIIGIGEHIYRLVYNCFGGIIPKYYQIHHIDYNRNNNNINNLLLVSGREHRNIHRPLAIALSSNNIPSDIEVDYNNYIAAHNSYKELEQYLNKYEEYKQNWNNYLLEQINKYKEYRRTEYKNRIEQQKLNSLKKQQEIQQAIQEERKRKLDSGEYSLTCDGRLSKNSRPKWTDERRNKTMSTRQTSEAWEQMGNKVSTTLKERWADDTFRDYMIECFNRKN